MALTDLPTVGGTLGQVKRDRVLGGSPDPIKDLAASQWNAAATALEQVCASVGLADGSTSGSLIERVDTLESPAPLAVRVVSTGTASIDTDDDRTIVYFSVPCTVTMDLATAGTRVHMLAAGGDLTLVAGSGVGAVVPASVVPTGTTMMALRDPGTSWLSIPNRKLANALNDVSVDIDPAGNGSVKRLDFDIDGGAYQFEAATASMPGDLTLTGDLAAANIASGAWTPTYTTVTNLTSANNQAARYMRFDDVVSVDIRMQVTPTSSGAWSCRVSLPVASNFTGALQAHGSGSAGNTTTFVNASADATNDELIVSGNASGTSTHSVFVSALYQVL